MQQKFKLCCLILGLSQLFSCGQSNQLSAWLKDDQKLSAEDSKIMAQWLLDNQLKAKDFKVSEPPKGFLGDYSVIVADRSIQAIRASGVSELSGLSQLRSLQSLELNHFKQADLSNCPAQLKSLRISGKAFCSLDGVASCQKLASIKVVHSNVTELNPLLALPQLSSLKINFSQLTAVEINHSALLLETLDLSHNKINQFVVNADLPQLNLLILDNNKLQSLELNKYTPVLHTLSVSNNLIQDLNNLEPVSSLSRIALKANPVHDLTVLQQWPNLGKIDFDGALVDGSEDLLSKISEPIKPADLQRAEAEKLIANYLNNRLFIETLPKSVGGQAAGLHKQLSSSFNLNGQSSISGEMRIDSLKGLMRVPVVTTDNLFHLNRTIQVQIRATVEHGQLNIYSPVDVDYWQMAAVFVESPIRQRPKDMDKFILKGFEVNQVMPGETVKFKAQLLPLVDRYMLILGSEHGEVTGVSLEFE